MLQLDNYFCSYFSGHQHTVDEKNTSSTNPGTMSHVMHVQFVFFAVFVNLKGPFS